MNDDCDMVIEPPCDGFASGRSSPSSTISPRFVSSGVSDNRQNRMQLDFDDPQPCTISEPPRPQFREGSFSKQMAELRLKKDLCELKRNRVNCDFAKTKVLFPRDPEVLDLRLTVSPVRGPYSGGNFEFNVSIPPMYPFYAPKVVCLTKVYHPNICMTTGRVYIAILGKDWRPVLTVNAVLLGLQLIFLEPNPNFPVNPECCEVYKHDPALFRKLVRQSVKFSEGEQIRSQKAPSPSSMMMVNDDNGPFASPAKAWRDPFSSATARSVPRKSKRRGGLHQSTTAESMHFPSSPMPVRKRMRKSVGLPQRHPIATSGSFSGASQHFVGGHARGFSNKSPRSTSRGSHSFFFPDSSS